MRGILIIQSWDAVMSLEAVNSILVVLGMRRRLRSMRRGILILGESYFEKRLLMDEVRADCDSPGTSTCYWNSYPDGFYQVVSLM